MLAYMTMTILLLWNPISLRSMVAMPLVKQWTYHLDVSSYEKHQEHVQSFQKRMIKLAESKEACREMPPRFRHLGKRYTPFGDKHIGFLGLAEHPTMDAIYELLDNIEFRADCKPFRASNFYDWRDHEPVKVALLKLGRPAMDALVKRLNHREYDPYYHGSGISILVEYYGKELAIERLRQASKYSDSALYQCIDLLTKSYKEMSR